MQNSVGWRNWGGNRGVSRTGPALGGGKLKQGSNPHIRAFVWVRRETFKAERERADLWQPKWNKNQTVLAANIHTPEGTVAGSWSLGIVKPTQGEGGCWLWKDGSRVCEGEGCGGKCLWKKSRQPWKRGDAAESRVGSGATTTASLPPQDSINSWTVERLAHQMSDVLKSRLGPPHQGDPSSAWCTDLHSRTLVGEPLYVTEVPNNREGPPGREPTKCLNGWSCGERLAKGSFWLPTTRGLDKDSDRAISPEVEAVCVSAHGITSVPTAKQLHHLHAQPSLGQSFHRQNKILHLCPQGCFSHVWLFATL